MPKDLFKATGKRIFRKQFVWLIGIGYDNVIINHGEDKATEIITIFLPLCIITAIQSFKRVALN